MPLPALRTDGTLPPGVHRATLDEVFAAFPATIPERQALDAALRHCVTTVKRLQLADDMALDGSYLTSKPDPEDVDIVVLMPGVYQLAGERAMPPKVSTCVCWTSSSPTTTRISKAG